MVSKQIWKKAAHLKILGRCRPLYYPKVSKAENWGYTPGFRTITLILHSIDSERIRVFYTSSFSIVARKWCENNGRSPVDVSEKRFPSDEEGGALFLLAIRLVLLTAFCGNADVFVRHSGRVGLSSAVRAGESTPAERILIHKGYIQCHSGLCSCNIIRLVKWP
jgi:hypothetical protein